MDVLSAVKQENIAASTEIDDLIFMGTPQQWSLQEQKQGYRAPPMSPTTFSILFPTTISRMPPKRLSPSSVIITV